MDSTIKLRRNTDLLSNREAALEALKTQSEALSDGEICVASFGDSWDTAETICGMVRSKDVVQQVEEDGVTKDVTVTLKTYTLLDMSNHPCVSIQSFNALKSLTTASTSADIISALNVQDSTGVNHNSATPKTCTTMEDIIAALSKCSLTNGGLPLFDRVSKTQINVGYNGQAWVLSGLETIPTLVDGSVQQTLFIWNISFSENSNVLSVLTPLARYSLASIQKTASNAYTAVTSHQQLYRDLGVFDSQSAAYSAIAALDICANESLTVAHFGYREDNVVYTAQLWQCLSWNVCRQIIYNRDKFYQRLIQFTSQARTEIKSVPNFSATFCDRLKWNTTDNKYVPMVFDASCDAANTDSIPIATSKNAGLMSKDQASTLTIADSRAEAAEAGLNNLLVWEATPTSTNVTVSTRNATSTTVAHSVTLPAATSTAAGVMTAEQAQKVDSLDTLTINCGEY